MTIYTLRTNPTLGLARRSRAGFSLVEVMIASGISTMVLAGVLSAFLFIGRAGFSSSGYSEMEAQLRRGLDTFARDASMANGITWNGAQSVTLSMPTAGSGSSLVTYAYDSSGTGATAGCFYRVAGNAASTASRRVLVRDVASDFSFARYKLQQNGVTDNAAANDLETKLIQVNLRVVKSAVTVASTSQSTRSARYLLRNKRVSN